MRRTVSILVLISFLFSSQPRHTVPFPFVPSRVHSVLRVFAARFNFVLHSVLACPCSNKKCSNKWSKIPKRKPTFVHGKNCENVCLMKIYITSRRNDDDESTVWWAITRASNERDEEEKKNAEIFSVWFRWVNACACTHTVVCMSRRFNVAQIVYRTGHRARPKFYRIWCALLLHETHRDTHIQSPKWKRAEFRFKIFFSFFRMFSIESDSSQSSRCGALTRFTECSVSFFLVDFSFLLTRRAIRIYSLHPAMQNKCVWILFIFWFIWIARTRARLASWKFSFGIFFHFDIFFFIAFFVHRLCCCSSVICCCQRHRRHLRNNEDLACLRCRRRRLCVSDRLCSLHGKWF